MNRSPSNTAGSDPTPNKKKGPAAFEQGDQFLAALDQTTYNRYHLIAYNTAYLILGHIDEANDVASSVFEYLCKGSLPDIPIEAQIRTLACSRAIDCVRSPRWQFWKKWSPLYEANEYGEEYERISNTLLANSIEEDLFPDGCEYGLLLAKAIDSLQEHRRRCFVLRYVEEMKPRAIAKILRLSEKQVSNYIYHARKQVANYINTHQENPC